MYPTIAIPQPTLPAVMPTDRAALTEIFYRHFQALAAKVRESNAAIEAELGQDANDTDGMMRCPTRQEIAAVMPAKVNAAVILGAHWGQVQNGGWAQYDGNGYSEDVDVLRSLYQGAAELGVEHAATVVELIDEFQRRKAQEEDAQHEHNRRNPWGNDVESDDYPCANYDDLDTRFYDLPMEDVMQQVIDGFETIAANAIVRRPMRLAA